MKDAQNEEKELTRTQTCIVVSMMKYVFMNLIQCIVRSYNALVHNNRALYKLLTEDNIDLLLYSM